MMRFSSNFILPYFSGSTKFYVYNIYSLQFCLENSKCYQDWDIETC